MFQVIGNHADANCSTHTTVMQMVSQTFAATQLGRTDACVPLACTAAADTWFKVSCPETAPTLASSAHPVLSSTWYGNPNCSETDIYTVWAHPVAGKHICVSEPQLPDLAWEHFAAGPFAAKFNTTTGSVDYYSCGGEYAYSVGNFGKCTTYGDVSQKYTLESFVF
ncbi:hypothetical protein HDU83_001056 [Entophlyctis luteolus]|nr:hypothetical protein HDU83_001056 [Entophlyctis luteolus]